MEEMKGRDSPLSLSKLPTHQLSTHQHQHQHQHQHHHHHHHHHQHQHQHQHHHHHQHQHQHHHRQHLPLLHHLHQPRRAQRRNQTMVLSLVASLVEWLASVSWEEQHTCTRKRALRSELHSHSLIQCCFLQTL